ncbi:MAG: hypothetical protein MZU95_05655 [Desulfomicrobium escambiense]|nr:hypothetical protein [Desulfomicrobium escambiense]
METMGYSADSLDYLVTPGVLKLFGDACLSYLDMTLKADTINYDPDREVLSATGLPSITERRETAGGTEMIYHIPQGQPAQTRQEPGTTARCTRESG